MNNQLAIINGVIYTGKEIISNRSLLIEHDRIIGIIDPKDLPVNILTIDAEGNNIAPGLIDLQIYGAGGFLFASSPDSNTLKIIGDSIVSTGTTSFMLTLATNELSVYKQGIDAVKNEKHAALLGLHLEGPYLNIEKRGAHPIPLIRKPNYQELKTLLQGAQGIVTMMTIAPEMFEEHLIKFLLKQGVLLSAGHSNATIQEANRAFNQGIRAVTHLFNGMSSFHHREPGLPGATFLARDVKAGIIADGIHVDYQALKIAKQLLKDRLFLITDAIEAANNSAYEYVNQGDRFTLADGTLSGTSLTLLAAVANCVKFADIDLEEALRMASLYPAQLIGHSELGRIEIGALANLIIFDHDYILRNVFLLGEEKEIRTCQDSS